MIQFDEHIFQLGWFNHQLEKTSKTNSVDGLGQWKQCQHLQDGVNRADPYKWSEVIPIR